MRILHSLSKAVPAENTFEIPRTVISAMDGFDLRLCES